MTSDSLPVKFESVLNFRDAGGISTTDGKRIKEKVIFRSANPDKISRKDINNLHELNIKTIVDLRAPYEVRKKKRTFDGIETISLPLDFEKTTRERLIPLLKQKNALDLIPEMTVSLYHEILDGSVSVFRNVIELLLDPSRYPLLIHCQAGKDRTGVICALTQLAMDADRGPIVDNYITSNDALVPQFKKMLTMRKILSFGTFPTDKILYAMTLRNISIESVIDRVNNHYGGIIGYYKSSGQYNSEFKELKDRFVK
jgi:protein-tyrosine phosphatase